MTSVLHDISTSVGNLRNFPNWSESQRHRCIFVFANLIRKRTNHSGKHNKARKGNGLNHASLRL